MLEDIITGLWWCKHISKHLTKDKLVFRRVMTNGIRIVLSVNEAY